MQIRTELMSLEELPTLTIDQAYWCDTDDYCFIEHLIAEREKFVDSGMLPMAELCNALALHINNKAREIQDLKEAVKTLQTASSSYLMEMTELKDVVRATGKYTGTVTKTDNTTGPTQFTYKDIQRYG